MTVTEAGQSRAQRGRSLKSAYLTGLIGSGIGALAPLVMIPLLLPALGEAGFGVWATATSFTSMLVFADLGLGAGLLTQLSSAFGRNDIARGRQLVSSSYFSVMLVAAIGLAMVVSIAAFAGVPALMGVAPKDRDVARSIIIAVACGYFATIPLSLITRVQFGVQQGWQANAWAAAGPLVAIPLVWGLARHDAPPLMIVAGAVAGPVIIALANNLVFYLGSGLGRALAPSYRLVRRADVRHLLTLGSAFAAVAILSNVALNIDNILISVVLSSAEVTVFTIAARLFRSAALLVNIIGMPLWAANGDALARGDFAWIRRTTITTAIGLAGAVTVFVIPTVALREEIVGVWVGPSVETPLSLYSGLAAWSVLVAFTMPFFVVQNAAGSLRVQAVGWGAFLLVSLGAKVVTLHIAGTNSLGWVTALTYAVTVTPSAIYGYHKVLRRGILSTPHVPPGSADFLVKPRGNGHK